MTGPFESEREAREAMRGQYEPTSEGNRQLLLNAVNAAGVALGAYDRRIVGWLAGWEPQTCAVIAGLIARAAEPQAGQP
jgi:hypothetical protein